MKKFLAACAAIVFANSFFFAASYMDNTYQKLADEYIKKAEKAKQAGEYDKSIDFSDKAKENAELSKAYIDMMRRRRDADDAMQEAKDKIAWAEEIGADKSYPLAYGDAKENYGAAEKSYDEESYEQAADYARKCVAALDGVKAVTPLPEYYIVKPWAKSKDCFWNISGKPFVYNNPRLWENLYQANKSALPRPGDPDLILPGMKMRIPSLTGEPRDGVYDSAKEYDVYSASK